MGLRVRRLGSYSEQEQLLNKGSGQHCQVQRATHSASDFATRSKTAEKRM